MAADQGVIPANTGAARHANPSVGPQNGVAGRHTPLCHQSLVIQLILSHSKAGVTVGETGRDFGPLAPLPAHWTQDFLLACY